MTAVLGAEHGRLALERVIFGCNGALVEAGDVMLLLRGGVLSRLVWVCSRGGFLDVPLLIVLLIAAVVSLCVLACC